MAIWDFNMYTDVQLIAIHGAYATLIEHSIGVSEDMLRELQWEMDKRDLEYT